MPTVSADCPRTRGNRLPDKLPAHPFQCTAEHNFTLFFLAGGPALIALAVGILWGPTLDQDIREGRSAKKSPIWV